MTRGCARSLMRDVEVHTVAVRTHRRDRQAVARGAVWARAWSFIGSVAPDDGCGETVLVSGPSSARLRGSRVIRSSLAVRNRASCEDGQQPGDQAAYSAAVTCG